MEKYLHKCLDSLIINDEGMKQLEVLVINDGSKDSSSQIAHEYQDKYPDTFRAIDKENGNYGSCINRGLKEATGKYVKVLDADDSVNTKTLEDIVALCKSVDVDLLITDFEVINEAGLRQEICTRKLHSNKILEFDEFIGEISNPLIEMHPVFYKTDNVKKIGYKQTEGISYTDQEWVFYPMTTVRTALYINKIFYRYLLGREGQTIDINVVLRSLGHKKEIIDSLISYKRKLDTTTINLFHDFLDQRIYEKSIEYYRLILTNVNEQRLIDDLVAYDKYLSEKFPFIRARVLNSTLHRLLPFKFVNYWVGNNYSVFSRQVIRMTNRVLRIMSKIRSYYIG